MIRDSDDSFNVCLEVQGYLFDSRRMRTEIAFRLGMQLCKRWIFGAGKVRSRVHICREDVSPKSLKTPKQEDYMHDSCTSPC